MMETYDIAIIGTGPAGISAAITATIRNKKIILFGSRELSDKIRKAHLIQNYPGFPECSGEDLCNAFAAHLEKMGIEITEEKINAVYPDGRNLCAADYEERNASGAVGDPGLWHGAGQIAAGGRRTGGSRRQLLRDL